MIEDNGLTGLELSEARANVAAAAERLAAACVEAMGVVDGDSGIVLQSLAGVAGVAAERTRADELEFAAAVSLCSRMVEQHAIALEQLRDDPTGLRVAVAAERCAVECQQTLLLIYESD